MSKLISLILISTMFMNTCFGMNTETRSSVESHQISQLLLKDLDRSIAKAQKKNESVEKTIERLNKDMDKNFLKNEQTLNKVLNKYPNAEKLKSHLKEVVRNLKFSSPLGKQKYLKDLENTSDIHGQLRALLNRDQFEDEKDVLFEKIRSAGSWVNYLEALKMETMETVNLKENKMITSDIGEIGSVILYSLATILIIGIPLGGIILIGAPVGIVLTLGGIFLVAVLVPAAILIIILKSL